MLITSNLFINGVGNFINDIIDQNHAIRLPAANYDIIVVIQLK